VNTCKVLSYKTILRNISVKLWIYDNPSMNTARMICSVEFPITEPRQSHCTPQLQSPSLTLLSILCSFSSHTLSLSPPLSFLLFLRRFLPLFLPRPLSVSLYLLHSIFLSIYIVTLYIPWDTLRTRSARRMALRNHLNRRFHHFEEWRAFHPRFMCTWTSGRWQYSTTRVSVKYNWTI